MPRLIALTVAVMAFGTSEVLAQGAFLGTLSEQAEQCASEFTPLRADAEQRGRLIREAGNRHAPPVEACELIGNFSQAETKMITFVEMNAARCGIPAQVADQLKAGHKNTENLQKKVCRVAQQMQPLQPLQPRGPAEPRPVGDFDPPTSFR